MEIVAWFRGVTVKTEGNGRNWEVEVTRFSDGPDVGTG